jgi:plasmid stability protein
MPVNLSIKNAPDDVVARLKDRATRNHRSLQGELMAIIEEAVTLTPKRPLTLEEYRARIQALREEIAVMRGVSLLDATEPPAA